MRLGMETGLNANEEYSIVECFRALRVNCEV